MGHLKQMYDKCFLHKHKIGACTLKQARSVYYFLRLAAVDPFLEYIECWCSVVLRQTCKDFNGPISVFFSKRYDVPYNCG